MCTWWLGCGADVTNDGGEADGGPGDGGAATSDLSSSDLSSTDAAVSTQPLAPGASTLMLEVAGQPRSVILYVPSGTQPLSLVIALHGNGDTNSNFVAALGLQALADQDGFVLAAPQGISQSFTFMGQPINGVDWDAYRSASSGNIDLPLLDALRTRLVASGSIDPHHVVVFGYSQGGFLSFRYGMEAASVLACTAVIAASDPLPGGPLVTQAARKIPVALQIGTNDPGLSGAQATRTELQQNGNPIQYNEIQGAGHVPFPGDPRVPLDYCRAQALP